MLASLNRWMFLLLHRICAADANIAKKPQDVNPFFDAPNSPHMARSLCIRGSWGEGITWNNNANFGSPSTGKA